MTAEQQAKATAMKSIAGVPWFPATRLRHTSVVKWSKPTTLTTCSVSRLLGRLPDHIMDEINTRLANLFGMSQGD